MKVMASFLPKHACLKIRPLWRPMLGLILGLVLLAVAVQQVELDQVWAGLTQAEPLWVALAFLAVLLTTVAKISRWRWLFPATYRPDLFPLGRALLVGQLFNALFPARVGDIVRAQMIGSEGRTSKATALGTVAAEKAFDVLFLLICGGLAAVFVPLPPWLDVSLLGMTVGGILFLLLVLAWPEQRILAWVERWGQRLPWEIGERLGAALQRVLMGLAALRELRMAAVACVWSAAIWTLAAGTNYLLFHAFDLRLSVEAALLLLVLLHLGVAPPSSPGRLGVFHALTVLGLAALGVNRSSGLAYATVLHLIVYLPQIVPGAVVLGVRRWSA